MTGNTPLADWREGPRERLYELLPAFLRYRDQSEPLDSPLRALMAVLERQYNALDRDIGQLYDDWFIETCQDWIAPYLADLLGVRGLDRPEAWVPGQRTRIANTLAYRQLKGTTAVLERVSRDVTGWACVVSPFFERISCNQSLDHVRSGRGRTADLRDRAALARFGGPFDTLARRPQISGSIGLDPSPNPRAGYNLADLGLYFFRLRSYPARRKTARKISPGCYTFHPLGIDQPLFAQPRSPGELTDPVTEREVPGPLRREVLQEELDALNNKAAAAKEHFGGAFGGAPAFEILDPRTGQAVPWRQIEIADLSSWQRPGPPGERPPPRSTRVQPDDLPILALDPELGRLAFATDYPVSGEVEVSYHYPACGDIGGGPYLRQDEPPPTAGRPLTVGGPLTGRADGVSHFNSLEDAVGSRPAGATSASILIVDSATYGGWGRLALEIELQPGTSLEIKAAPGEAPSFIGDLRLMVHPGEAPSRVMIEGLAIGGTILVGVPGEADHDGARCCELELRDCTVTAPDLALGKQTGGPMAGIELEPDPLGLYDLDVRLISSILGPVAIPSGCGHLTILDSVVDGGPWAAISGSMGSVEPAGGPAEIRRCTIFGRVFVDRIVAEDTIFAGPVSANARHLGRFSHCYVPAGSAAGWLEKCQPAKDVPLAPVFTSQTYGQAGYGQLASHCPREIRTGASNGSEMGAFAKLGNPFREANLAGILEEYMPWGLEPRIFHVT